MIASTLRSWLAPSSSRWTACRHRLPPTAPTILLPAREKHSSTQKKRLFYKNPARLRYEERNGIDHFTQSTTAETTPTYAPIVEPSFYPNGWSAPPGPDVTVPEYPFCVRRTRNKPNDAIGFLPVYTHYRKDGTKTTTRIKKITGDRDAFLEELRVVLGLPQPLHPTFDAIRIRTGGTVEIDGSRAREVRQWLAGLGF